MSKKQRQLLRRILLATVLFVAGMFLDGRGLDGLLLACYVWIGWDILWRAMVNIRQGEVFDENFLMAIATVGAMGLGEFSEGVAVMLFYQVGEWFQSYAVGRSRQSISKLMDIRPDYANIERDGVVVRVAPEEVAVGDVILVRPGERVPMDGVILTGISMLDTSALTGESMPKTAEAGMQIISGCINQTGRLTIRTTKSFADSTVAKILDLVENAGSRKAHMENFITRFARYYTPVVVVGAVVLALVPPMLLGQAFTTWFYRALTFLVISCPCALVISVPLSFFGGIGGASKSGILVKGSSYLEVLARTETVVFDKTGTLTKGQFVVTRVEAAGRKQTEILELAAYVEADSNHPIAGSIKEAYGREIRRDVIEALQEIPGRGIKACVHGQEILAGNYKLMQAECVADVPREEAGTVVYLAVDGVYAGAIYIADELKADAAETICGLKQEGIQQTVMLTGDAAAAAQSAGKKLGVDAVYAELLPVDKVERVEAMLAAKAPGKMLAFVGDGINDAPVLARADVGIAMGGMGSDAAIEAADIVLMTDEPSKLLTAMRIARKTVRIARQNVVFAVGVKVVVLCLGALGFASLWAAVFADVGVCVLAILNAMRAMRVARVPKHVQGAVFQE